MPENHPYEFRKTYKSMRLPRSEIDRIVQQGLQHQLAGNLSEAEAIYRRILEVEPQNAGVLNLLGVIANEKEHFERAAGLFEQALTFDKRQPEFLNNYGNALMGLARPAEAARCFRRALKLKPAFAHAWSNLGNALFHERELKEAKTCFERALRLNPKHADAHNGLGEILREQGDLAGAIASYRNAVECDPGFAEASNNLGASLHLSGDLDEAALHLAHAIALKPNFVGAYLNLGNLHLARGEFDRAFGLYRQAVAIEPNGPAPYNSLLLALTFAGFVEEAAGLAKSDAFAARFASLEEPGLTFSNPRDPDRRLKIGYLSADFREHAVAYFTEPLLAHHDRDRFETFLYCNSPVVDAVTRRFMRYANYWHNISRLSDDEATRLIRSQRIDILVDLAGHTAGNRILVLAKRVAPLQVSYMGYLNTAGLKTIDYRLTDSTADPEGVAEPWHTEKLVRLPGGLFCYRPPADAPAVSPLPAMTRGYITWGSFNNFSKINDRVVECWAALMGRIPASRLLLAGIPDGSAAIALKRNFARHGVSEERLTLCPRVPRARFWQLLDTVDMALDSFPCTGGATTCAALWMGLPVVTLGGSFGATRSTASILHAIGLDHLIAASPEEYIKVAAGTVQDAGRLAALRSGLRGMMQGSPLMDAATFTRNVERVYRQIWRNWCAQKKEGSSGTRAGDFRAF